MLPTHLPKYNFLFERFQTSRPKQLPGRPVVSVLAFFSDDPSSKPKEVYKSYRKRKIMNIGQY